MTLEIYTNNYKQLNAEDYLSLEDPDRKVIQTGNIIQEYDKFRSRYEGKDTLSLFDKLITPFLEEEVELDTSRIKLSAVERDTDCGNKAAEVVNFAYNSRYVRNGGEVVDMATDNLDFDGNSKIIIAKQQVGGEGVVLATFRVVYGSELDVFKLFEAEFPNEWPHRAEVTQENFPISFPGELGRFSLHPIFDIIGSPENPLLREDSRTFKKLLLKKMWPEGMSLLRENGVTHPYFILAPHVKEFVASAGIIPKDVEGIVPTESDYALGIRSKFKEYWKPESNIWEQPEVYIAPWEVTE